MDDDSTPFVEAVKRRAARRDKNEERARRVGDQTMFECLCECANTECDATFRVEGAEFERCLKRPHLPLGPQPSHFLVALGHSVGDAEYMWNTDHLRDEQDAHVEVFAPNPAAREPLDTAVLKLEVASLREDVRDSAARLTATSLRIAGAMATGALILGVFTALGPDRHDTLASVLLGLAALPLLGVALASIWGPGRVEAALDKALYPMAHSGLVELGAKMREWSAHPERGLEEQPLSIASYEQAARRSQARQTWWQPGARALLPEEDRLLLEVDLLVHTKAAHDAALKVARRRQEIALSLLALLVFYLVAMTIALRLTG